MSQIGSASLARGEARPTEGATTNHANEEEEEEEEEEQFFDARLTPDEEEVRITFPSLSVIDHTTGRPLTLELSRASQDLVGKSNTQKDSANNLFASSAFSDAVSVYDRAISLLPTYLDYQVAVLKSNIAACHLKLQDWNSAVDSATASLECLDRADEDASSQLPAEDRRNDQRESSMTVVELPDDHEEDAHAMEQLTACYKRKEDIKRIRTKSLLRRSRARTKLGSWAHLEGAREDLHTLLSLETLPPNDQRTVKLDLQGLAPKIEAAKEHELGDVMDKLKNVSPKYCCYFLLGETDRCTNMNALI